MNATTYICRGVPPYISSYCARKESHESHTVEVDRVPQIRLSGDTVALVKDAEIADLRRQLAEKDVEIDRLTHLHNLDHSLADQYEERRMAADRTAEAFRSELAATQRMLETVRRQRDEYLTELQAVRGVERDGDLETIRARWTQRPAVHDRMSFVYDDLAWLMAQVDVLRVRVRHHQAMEARALQMGDRMRAVVEWARRTCHGWRLGGVSLVGYHAITEGERVLYELDNPQPPDEDASA